MKNYDRDMDGIFIEEESDDFDDSFLLSHDTFGMTDDLEDLDEQIQKVYDSAIQARVNKSFASKPKHGVYAHAYKQKYDNGEILRLRGEGKSYREIAKILNIPFSTVRNRIIKMRGNINK